VVSPAIDWDDVRRALTPAPQELPSAPAAAAAVALILREGAEGLDLLFVQRAEHPEDPWSGHMAFPGGRAEPGDRDPSATAVRETLEEIGLDLAATGDPLGALDEIQTLRRGQPIELAIRPFVFRLRVPVELEFSEEIVSAHWIPLATLFAPASRAVVEMTFGGAHWEVPCLRVDGRVIWGLTYRMFAGFALRLGIPGWTHSVEPLRAPAADAERT
jgi:8-oxo-dGTP pyrophosphatase MutT (NUDIX family)